MQLNRKRINKKKMAWIFLGIGGSYLLLCFWLARGFVIPPRFNLANLPEELHSLQIPGPNYQIPILVNSLPSKNSRSEPIVFVMAHGYGGTQADWFELSLSLEKAGYCSVIPSMRAHGDSPAKQCAFGVGEAEELIYVIQWLKKQVSPNVQVILVGISLGGAACWLASEKEPSIKAVVTEGAFANLDEATCSYLNHMIPGGSWLLRPVLWIGCSMSGVQMGKVNPEYSAKKWRGKPALIIHGQQDRLFHWTQGQRLSAAANCKFWLVPEAHHAQVQNVAFEKYLKALLLMAEYLKK